MFVTCTSLLRGVITFYLGTFFSRVQGPTLTGPSRKQGSSQAQPRGFVHMLSILTCAISGVYTTANVLITLTKHVHGPTICQVYCR